MLRYDVLTVIVTVMYTVHARLNIAFEAGLAYQKSISQKLIGFEMSKTRIFFACSEVTYDNYIPFEYGLFFKTRHYIFGFHFMILIINFFSY